MQGKPFQITACVVQTVTGNKLLPAGVAFVPQPLTAGILAVPLVYSSLQKTYELLPAEWNRLLSDGFAKPK